MLRESDRNPCYFVAFLTSKPRALYENTKYRHAVKFESNNLLPPIALQSWINTQRSLQSTSQFADNYPSNRTRCLFTTVKNLHWFHTATTDCFRMKNSKRNQLKPQFSQTKANCNTGSRLHVNLKPSSFFFLDAWFTIQFFSYFKSTCTRASF